MTRAVTLLRHGDWLGSLAMHPLAVPTALVQMTLAAASVVVVLDRGSPFELMKVRYGRAAIYAVAVVCILLVALWIARMFGFAGGPVLV